MGSNHKSLQAILGAPGVRGKRVTALSKDGLTDFVLSMISKKQELKEPFYVLDLGVVVSLMEKWSRALPLVRPFYAVKAVFDTASRLGLPRMHVLNIGGGFTSGPHFDDATSAIKSSLQAYFPNEHGLTIIGEPGRYFAESAFTLVTNIIGKRVRSELREYWINDPLACTSNSVNPTCRRVRTYSSTVFGPTCDALDTVLTGHQLPELQVNDWLMFPRMGAYTAAAGSNFNGFNMSAVTTHLVYSNPT
uniref:Ornithine decarboxylase n=1 Tax=Vitis vinifera TaxID=29760 RepID=F6H0D3_VITVI